MTDESPTLFDPKGRRLYLTEDERRAFLKAARTAPRPTRTLCGVLHYTGCRITEALRLTPHRVDLTAETITFQSLKKRGGAIVYRSVPIPPDFLDVLNMVHGLREGQGTETEHEPLWAKGYSRTSAWRRIKEVMECATRVSG